jgi:hypothetical protein
LKVTSVKHATKCWLSALCLCLCVATSCAAGDPTQESSMTLDPATAAYQKHGYNTLPVEARLGPHVFRIPANYFRDQIGADFQGNWSVMVQWPDLEPLPPGKRSGQDMETFGRQITISPRYIDRVPIETRLEVASMPPGEPGRIEYENPRYRLDLMLPQAEWHGLTPYIVDETLLEAYDDRYSAHYGTRRTPTRRENHKDWFVSRNVDGSLRTLIRCDQESEPDVYSSPVCNHDLVIPELKIAVSISYRRTCLPGWENIENRARDLLEASRVKSPRQNLDESREMDE